MTAAASDARMDGCALPVMSNSGSGNQGITTILPVVAIAQKSDASEEVPYAFFKKGETLVDPFMRNGIIPIEAGLFNLNFPVNYYQKEKFLFKRFPNLKVVAGGPTIDLVMGVLYEDTDVFDVASFGKVRSQS